MSWVANVMLSVAADDIMNALTFADWIEHVCPRRHGADGVSVGNLIETTGPTSQWGGFKHPECHVFAGALNHADLDALIAQFGATGWLVPLAVQLFVMDQEEHFFRVWMVREGVPRQYVPTIPDENSDEFWPPLS